VQVREDRPDADVVETRRDRMRVVHEAFVVLEEDALVPLRDAERALAAREARGVLRAVDAVAARFHADELDGLVVEEAREDARRIRAASHARVHATRKL